MTLVKMYTSLPIAHQGHPIPDGKLKRYLDDEIPTAATSMFQFELRRAAWEHFLLVLAYRGLVQLLLPAICTGLLPTPFDSQEGKCPSAKAKAKPRTIKSSLTSGMRLPSGLPTSDARDSTPEPSLTNVRAHGAFKIMLEIPN